MPRPADFVTTSHPWVGSLTGVSRATPAIAALHPWVGYFLTCHDVRTA